MTDAPAVVEAAMERARTNGFELSSEPEVGRFLAVLAAAVRTKGRIAELGTGCGVGTAWMVTGLGPRTDVGIVSIESNAMAAAIARSGRWPDYVTLLEGDGLEEAVTRGPYDLVFADCPAGKWWGIDTIVATIRPGGLYVVDDMHIAADPDHEYYDRMWKTRETILSHPELVAAELDFGSGVIVAAKR